MNMHHKFLTREIGGDEIRNLSERLNTCSDKSSLNIFSFITPRFMECIAPQEIIFVYLA